MLEALDGLGRRIRKERLTSVLATLEGPARPHHPAAGGHGCPARPGGTGTRVRLRGGGRDACVRPRCARRDAGGRGAPARAAARELAGRVVSCSSPARRAITGRAHAEEGLDERTAPAAALRPARAPATPRASWDAAGTHPGLGRHHTGRDPRRGGHARHRTTASTRSPSRARSSRRSRPSSPGRVDAFDPAVDHDRRSRPEARATSFRRRRTCWARIRTVSERTRERVLKGVEAPRQGLAAAHGAESKVKRSASTRSPSTTRASPRCLSRRHRAARRKRVRLCPPR